MERPHCWKILLFVLGMILCWILSLSLWCGSCTRPSLTVAGKPHHSFTQIFSKKDVWIHPDKFHFLLKDNGQCRRDGLKLLILVQTSAKNVARRQLLRETYGSRKSLSRYNAVMIYFVGIVRDEKVMRSVQEESRIHGDIVQEDYVDSYRNLTYKAVSWLKWTAMFCRNVENVIQVDDDVFVNLPGVTQWYKHDLPLIYRNTPHFVACAVLAGLKPKREKRNKYYVSTDEYTFDRYEPFCYGTAFMTNSATTIAMYEASKGSEFFWIEDVYQTMMLGQRIGLYLIRAHQVIYGGRGRGSFTESSIFKRYVLISQRNERELRQLWDLTTSMESKLVVH